MKNIFKNTMNLFKERIYLYPLIITCIFSFGYVLTHSTINIDTLSLDRYLNGELLSQGRFIVPLIHKITNLYSFNPLFLDLLSVFVFAFGITFFCGFIKEISNNKFKTISYTIMSCLFVSYPLLPEIFTYTPAGLNVAFGYLLTFISVALAYKNKDKNVFKFLLSFIPLMCAISMYESFASVYLLIVSIIFYFDFIKETKIKKVIKKIWKYFIPLLLAIVFNYFISSVIISILDLQKSTNAAKVIYYLVLPFSQCIKLLINSLINNFILSSKYYFPITMLYISSILAFIYFSIKSIKSKNKFYILSFLFIIISVFSLSFLQGNAAPYRTCQTFALFVGFVFLLISNVSIKSNKNILKYITIVLSFVLIFYQCKDMHKWFYVNDIRYQEEKQVLINISNRLKNEKFDLNKPIIPIGAYNMSQNINDHIYYTIEKSNFTRKIGQTNVNSYINWAIEAFNEPGTELLKFWKYLGYDYKLGTNNMRNEAIIYASNNNLSNGEIVELDNYIIVCFDLEKIKIIIK